MVAFDWRPKERQTLTVQGKVLEAEAFGPSPGISPTILLLHEGLGCVDLWREFPSKLSESTGWGVFAWSRVGYGRSPVRPPPWPVNYMEQEALHWLPEVLDSISAQNYVLFGHSDGASIAAFYGGVIKDERLKGLILMAPHFFTEPGGQASIAATHKAFSGTLRDRINRYHEDVDATFGGWSGAWLNPEFLTWNITSKLNGISVPVLAIQGAEDEYGTLAHIHELEKRAKAEVRLAILQNCRHSPHLDQPNLTLDSVTKFLAELKV